MKKYIWLTLCCKIFGHRNVQVVEGADFHPTKFCLSCHKEVSMHTPVNKKRKKE